MKKPRTLETFRALDAAKAARPKGKTELQKNPVKLRRDQLSPPFLLVEPKDGPKYR
jgi:hypothetical protein